MRLTYCDFPGVLPELEPELPLLEPEPMPLLDPLLGAVLGDVDGLGELLGEVLLLPPAPAPEPDLLKCASHSAREIWPSLFVSTDEKLGDEELEPLDVALPPDAGLAPEDDAPEDGVVELAPLEPDAAGDDAPEDGVLELAPLEPDAAGDDGVLELELAPLEPEAAGEDDDLSAPPVLLDEELCARAAPERASRAAAVAALKSFRLNIRMLPFQKDGRTARDVMQDMYPRLSLKSGSTRIGRVRRSRTVPERLSPAIGNSDRGCEPES